MIASVVRNRRTQIIWAALLALFLAMGLVFRLANFDRKVFWVDEVATTLRAVGYTKAEVTHRLADGTIRHPQELLVYQQLTPERSLSDAMAAFRSSPEHAPLYFLLIRIWIQVLGSSVAAVRSFSILCSLLLLPAIYWLSRLLFAKENCTDTNQINPNQVNAILTSPQITSPQITSPQIIGSQISSNLIGQAAVMLMAISPFFIAYAQEARPYSLWVLLLVLCSGALLRAIQRNTIRSWMLYAVALAISLYTSLLTLAIALGQVLYVVILVRVKAGKQTADQTVDQTADQTVDASVIKPIYQSQLIRRFGVALAAAIAALLPWLWLTLQQWQTIQANTTWMQLPIEAFAKVTIWFYSIAILYFDVPVITDPIWIAMAELAVATGVVVVVGYAFYHLHRVDLSGLFVLSLALPVPLLLILLDLVSNGRYSTAPRYMLPLHLGSQLATAYLLIERFHQSKRQFKWHSIALCLVMVSLVSNLVHLNASPRYLKNRNLHNLPIAALINSIDRPLIVSESENTLDLISLSYLLDADTMLKILPTSALLSHLIIQPARPSHCNALLLFNPSPALRQQLQQDPSLHLEQRYFPKVLTPSEFALSLWQIHRNFC